MSELERAFGKPALTNQHGGMYHEPEDWVESAEGVVSALGNAEAAAKSAVA